MESTGAGYPQPHTCRFCQQILFRLFSRYGNYGPGTFENPEDGQPWLRRCTAPGGHLYDPYLQLEISRHFLSKCIAQGCEFFSALSDAAPEQPPYYMKESDDLVIVVRMTSTYLEFGTMELRRRSRSIADSRAYDDLSIPEFRAYDNLSFAMVTEQGNPAMPWIGQGPNNVHPSSNESLLVARSWLQTCLDTHDLCNVPASNFMPTRLLKIENSDGQFTLQLQDVEPNIHCRYAALSYCWGGEQALRTTKENLAQHRCAVRYDHLPPTLRDAVLTTHALGIRHLWVDALCIVQDDDRTRASEIDMMSFVYSSAAVSILASRARSVHEGFLQDRRTFYGSHNPRAFKLKFQCPEGDIGDIVIVSTEPADVESERLRYARNEPLWERGWAFQERLASRRILEYGTFRTHWFCQTRKMSDMYKFLHGDDALQYLWAQRFKNMGIPEMANVDVPTEVETEKGFSGRELPFADMRNQGLRTALLSWKSIVFEFTHKQLTFQTDRLAAIAGIAKRFQSAFQANYLAGIWESTIPYELLWIAEPYSPLNQRPNNYIAPSWSWAALTGPVYTKNFDWGHSPVIEVMEAEVSHQGGFGKYGAVKSGRLKLKGFLTDATWTIPQNPSGHFHYEQGELRARDTYSHKYRSLCIYPDAVESGLWNAERCSIDVYLLAIQAIGEAERVTGLILHRSKDGTYSRLGVFDCQSIHYSGTPSKDEVRRFLEVPKQTVVIV